MKRLNYKNILMYLIIMIIMHMTLVPNVYASSRLINPDKSATTTVEKDPSSTDSSSTKTEGPKSDLADLNIAMDSEGRPYIQEYKDPTYKQSSVWNDFFYKYRGFLVGVSGVFTLTFVGLFIFNITKLGQSADNPQLRTSSLIGIMWTGIGFGGFMALTIFMGLAFKLFR